MEQQTVDETLDAFLNVTTNLEESFVTLGQMLSDINKRNLYQFKGYTSMKDYVENEFGISSAFASKVRRVYDIYVGKLDLSGEALSEIGLERLYVLSKIHGKVTDTEFLNDWFDAMAHDALPDLRAAVKEWLDKQKQIDLKAILFEQFKEQWCTILNCSWKELRFKIALIFSDIQCNEDAVQAVKARLHTLQSRFEQNDDQSGVEQFVEQLQEMSNKDGISITLPTPGCEDVTISPNNQVIDIRKDSELPYE